MNFSLKLEPWTSYEISRTKRLIKRTAIKIKVFRNNSWPDLTNKKREYYNHRHQYFSSSSSQRDIGPFSFSRKASGRRRKISSRNEAFNNMQGRGQISWFHHVHGIRNHHLSIQIRSCRLCRLHPSSSLVRRSSQKSCWGKNKPFY